MLQKIIHAGVIIRSKSVSLFLFLAGEIVLNAVGDHAGLIHLFKVRGPGCFQFMYASLVRPFQVGIINGFH